MKKYKVVYSKDLLTDFSIVDENVKDGEIENSVIIGMNDSDKIIVMANDPSKYNKSFVSSRDDIEFLNTKFEGGCIVLFPGDVTLSVYEKNSTELLENIAGCIYCWLNDTLDRTKYELGENNNDILVNGNKIYGVHCTPIPDTDVYYSGLFLSWQHDQELIERICKKKAIKKPLGLSELGYDKKEIQDKVIEIVKRICEE